MLIRRTETERPGVIYNALGGLAANTPRTIVAAASNTKGLVVWNAFWWASSNGTLFGSLIAKASAPSAWSDADVLLFGGYDRQNAAATNFFMEIKSQRPFYVPAGKGLYAIATQILTGDLLTVSYTLKG